MTRRCHSHIAFRYKRLMLCKYKVSPIQARSSSHAGIVKAALYLASRPFRKRDDVRRRRTYRYDTRSRRPIRQRSSVSLCPLSGTDRVGTSRKMNSQNDRLKIARQRESRPGPSSVQLRSSSRAERRLKSWHDHRNTRYQFPYAPCRVLVLRESATPVSFTTSRFGSR